MSPSILDPIIPQDSRILVTAANGIIATHIVDQLLSLGFPVRGTVRSLSRCSWLPPLFSSRHPGSSFTLVEIQSSRASLPVIHVAAVNIFADELDAIPQSVAANLRILEAVARANKQGGDIKRVVITSSSWAVIYPQPNIPAHVTPSTYNLLAAKSLADHATPKQARALLTFVASKVAAEQESWAWMATHPDAKFVLNTVVPSSCFGPVLAPEYQEYPTTAGFVRSLYEGKNEGMFEWMEPQWFVHLRDSARLHVAAAVLKGVEGERVFAWAETYTWLGVRDVLEDEMGRNVGVTLKNKGVDLSTYDEKRSLELLERMGCIGWEGFATAVRENIRSYYPKE
ncbi:hypothetical protein BCR34DRAFT_632289 [Clohesyomyces aquaticus]|uniref:NAD-dependent epimerase/dehydratase domain-containing protein n=1 Tax=Clohesyomyces aquaticus TaxID=1231657 RepID=A0A1Y1Z7Y3_9PLEO|nr:hypothetical protein BCR34DRAFT_632289 [Clohesyomyces aquaticus]